MSFFGVSQMLRKRREEGKIIVLDPLRFVDFGPHALERKTCERVIFVVAPSVGIEDVEKLNELFADLTVPGNWAWKERPFVEDGDTLYFGFRLWNTEPVARRVQRDEIHLMDNTLRETPGFVDGRMDLVGGRDTTLFRETTLICASNEEMARWSRKMGGAIVETRKGFVPPADE
jgi:hypothetical protein